MEEVSKSAFVLITAEDLESLKDSQQQMILLLKQIKSRMDNPALQVSHITDKEFMKATGIKKTKFYDMVNRGKINVFRKVRKTYVLASEVQRYFSDPGMY